MRQSSRPLRSESLDVRSSPPSSARRVLGRLKNGNTCHSVRCCRRLSPSGTVTDTSSCQGSSRLAGLLRGASCPLESTCLPGGMQRSMLDQGPSAGYGDGPRQLCTGCRPLACHVSQADMSGQTQTSNTSQGEPFSSQLGKDQPAPWWRFHPGCPVQHVRPRLQPGQPACSRRCWTQTRPAAPAAGRPPLPQLRAVVPRRRPLLPRLGHPATPQAGPLVQSRMCPHCPCDRAPRGRGCPLQSRPGAPPGLGAATGSSPATPLPAPPLAARLPPESRQCWAAGRSRTGCCAAVAGTLWSRGVWEPLAAACAAAAAAGRGSPP